GGSSITAFLRDMLPYLALTLAIIPVLLWVGGLCPTAVAALVVEAVVALVLYVGANWFAGSVIQKEVFTFLRF
ncbi:MAG: hypothetical protein K2M12_01380, partial [Muribaculaceae bacterium]|nr:hypothetical protein [Muribaculaceae bacterium]